MNKTIILNDSNEIKDNVSLNNAIAARMNGGVQKTVVKIFDHESGELLQTTHNKITIPGSLLAATNTFDVQPSFIIPDYNTAMDLENTLDYANMDPYTKPFICLFAVDDSGCGTTKKDVYTVNYTDRIKPAVAGANWDSTTIMPFRWVKTGQDLNDNLRKFYYGRREYPDLGRIGYFFKTPDTEPQLHLRYADGTMLTGDFYEFETDQIAECYVELRLRINKMDFRDYFENYLGWDKARVSSISLISAWIDDRTDEDYRYYQQAMCATKVNFSYEELVDTSRGLDIIYCIYY